MSLLPVGTRVTLSPKSPWNDGCKNNPLDVEGTITRNGQLDDFVYDVAWDNATTNAYYIDCLIPVKEKGETMKNIPNGFSKREAKKIHKLVSKGKTKADVARTFGCSRDTIRRVCKWVEENSTSDVRKSLRDKAVKATVKAQLPGQVHSVKVEGSFESTAPKASPKPVSDASVKVDSTVRQAMERGEKVDYIITPVSIVLNFNGDVEIIEETHPAFEDIRTDVLAGNFSAANAKMNVAKSIAKYTSGAITIADGALYYGELQLHSNLVDRIISLMQEGDESFKPMVEFLKRLMMNPSKDSVEQLWGFLKDSSIEITQEGTLICWKQVKEKDGKYFDSHTGKVPNEVGNVLEMPRHMVNDDKHQTCSQGLHVAAWEYASNFYGGTMLKVEVDPADVVSVPRDYKDQKMRAAKYTVMAVIDKQTRQVVSDKVVNPQHIMVGQCGELLSVTDI